MSRILLLSSAVFLGLLGFVGTFIPAEVLAWSDIEPAKSTTVILQIMGGLYLGFAVLNWMSRHGPMGGIYGKPVAMANLVHFMIVGLMLVKEVIQGGLGNAFIVLSILYAVFALGFASTMFFDPLSGRRSD